MGQPQGRVSNLRFSLDNWIYVSNDGHPGEVIFLGRPNAEPVSVLGTDFRFRLDRGLFEPASGAARFGQTLDDWGNRFLTRTGTHVLHVVLARRYLSRNPFLVPATQAEQDISDHGRQVYPLTPAENWREARTRIRQQRSDELGLDRKMQVSGVFTGATGGTIYAGDSLPDHYHGNLFTAGIAGNLVHRDLLEPDGISFLASRPRSEGEHEFLASTDPWFRPVQFKTGWDGTLYMLDMYRLLVEDPESIPEPIKKDLDFYAGTDLGRIYRIVPVEPSPSPDAPSLGESESSSLVQLLSHPNRWWRLTAQRLLIQRQDRSTVTLLEETVREERLPQARLQALYCLESLQALTAETLADVLEDPHPALQEHAVRLAEGFPELLNRLLLLCEKAGPRVSFQLALSLGESNQESVYDALDTLALRNPLEPEFRTAILSSDAGSSLKLLRRLLARPSFFSSAESRRQKFLEELAAVISARNRGEEISRLLSLLSRSSHLNQQTWKVAGLRGMAIGLELGRIRGLQDDGAKAALKQLLSSPVPSVAGAANRVARHFRMPSLWAAASREALDQGLSTQRRIQAIRTLEAVPFKSFEAVYTKLLDTQPDPELRTILFRTLASFDDPRTTQLVLSRWKTLSPRERKAALGALLGHGQRVTEILDALEGGQMEPAALELGHRVLLIQHPDEKIRRRALALFKQMPGERDEVVRRYQKVLGLKGEATRGEAVFERE